MPYLGSRVYLTLGSHSTLTIVDQLICLAEAADQKGLRNSAQALLAVIYQVFDEAAEVDEGRALDEVSAQDCGGTVN